MKFMNMGKLKRGTFAALLFVLLSTLFSCNKYTDDDLHRVTMNWTSDYTGDPRNITVPANGGTYKLVCTSYPTLRFASMVVEESAAQYGDKVISTSMVGRWYTAELTGNTLTITIKPNTTGKVRNKLFWLRSDDAIDRVSITQEK